MVGVILTRVAILLEMTRLPRVRVIREGRYAPERHRQRHHERRHQQSDALSHLLTPSPLSPPKSLQKRATDHPLLRWGSRLRHWLSPPRLSAHLFEEAGFKASTRMCVRRKDASKRR